MNNLKDNQQGFLLMAAEKPENMVLALSRNQKRLAALAAIDDPIVFAATVARLEKGMKIFIQKTPHSTRKTDACQRFCARIHQVKRG